MKIASIESHRQVEVTMEGATGAKMRMLIGPDEAAPNFHMRHFEVAPGGHTPHHRHDYEHEILILKGRGIARSERGDRSVGPGDVLFVPANEVHQFVTDGPDPLEFICLIPAPKDCSK
ncbi:MAG: cupin domain-containing protein [Phycisphaerales bacterium]|nr:MAG: cupin domain-containing protein [Phycisphaerales bacterium]